jgi:hypothetical protein
VRQEILLKETGIPQKPERVEVFEEKPQEKGSLGTSNSQRKHLLSSLEDAGKT